MAQLPQDRLLHPYAEFLHEVDKPARYTGGEVGAAERDWDAVDARVCLAFPDVYDIGMSHLGFKILYKILNDDPRTLAERAYCPWVDMEALLRARGLPLVSLESYRSLRDFDVVGFSLQYELTYSNVLTMLDLGGIPLRSADRGDDDPLVVAGGPNATHPEPVAPFFDAIVIGDGEAKLTEIALAWVKSRGKPRIERLRQLAQLGAVYVPGLYEVAIEPENGIAVVTEPSDRTLPFPIERAMVNINDYPFPDDGPTGGPEAIFDRTSIEITRGCTEGCRFCQAGMIYRPVQERDPQQVLSAVRNSLKNSGNDEVSLTALSTADVSFISPLIKTLAPELAEKRVSLSVSSLRAYGLEPDLLDDLSRVRAGGLTFAPEAGTQRMRDVVNKNVTEEQLHETAERVFSRGYTRMKLYFMIGLPSEQDEDVLGIAETGIRTSKVGRAVTKRAEVTVSVSTHVPKPHTPFQWAAMDDKSEVGRKQYMLKDRLRNERGIKLRTHDCSSSVLEGVMARGDRRLADVIERAWRNGARFDSWDELLDLAVWEEALEHHGIDKAPYLATLPVYARLPWDHIDVGLEEGFLLREYRRALHNRLSPPCGKVAGMFIHHTNTEDAGADERKLVCYDCGVACDMTNMREERLLFLDGLGAKSRPAASPVEDRPSATRKKGPRIGDPNEGFRYRLRFQKKGPAALLGHLDLVRELPRIFRRINVEPVYTGGYHPRPAMTFTPALSLGLTALGEYVDVRLAEDLPGPELIDKMNGASSAGLVFCEAKRLGPRDRNVSRMVTSAEYALLFAPDVIAADDPIAWLKKRCDALLAADRLVIHRKVKGIGKKVDLRPRLLTLRLLEQPAELLRHAAIAGDLVGVSAQVVIGNDGSVRMRELVELMWQGEPPPYRAVRVALSMDESVAAPVDIAVA